MSSVPAQARVAAAPRALRLRRAAPRVRARRLRRRGAAGRGRRARCRATGRWRCAWPTAPCSAGHARPPDRALAERPAGRLDPPRARRAAARALRAALPARRARLRRRRRTPSSSPRRTGARATASSTPCCAAPRARARPRCSTRLTDDTPEQAAVKHSHPEWIARLWWEELGAERGPRADGRRQRARRGGAAREHAASPTPPALAPRSCRVRRRHAATPRIPEALVLEGPFDVHGSPLWRAGAFLAQSRAAMLVARALDPRPGERVLDLCAAPGGKSTHLAALMAGSGEVVAVERNRAPGRRARAHRAAAARGNVRVEVADAARARAPEGPVFDRVLVDPPCSGLGTLQARPDLRWRVDPRGGRRDGRRAGADSRRRRRRPPSGRRACLLYLHDLPDRERAPDRRLP